MSDVEVIDLEETEFLSPHLERKSNTFHSKRDLPLHQSQLKESIVTLEKEEQKALLSSSPSHNDSSTICFSEIFKVTKKPQKGASILSTETESRDSLSIKESLPSLVSTSDSHSSSLAEKRPSSEINEKDVFPIGVSRKRVSLTRKLIPNNNSGPINAISLNSSQSSAIEKRVRDVHQGTIIELTSSPLVSRIVNESLLEETAQQSKSTDEPLFVPQSQSSINSSPSRRLSKKPADKIEVIDLLESEEEDHTSLFQASKVTNKDPEVTSRSGENDVLLVDDMVRTVNVLDDSFCSTPSKTPSRAPTRSKQHQSPISISSVRKVDMSSDTLNGEDEIMLGSVFEVGTNTVLAKPTLNPKPDTTTKKKTELDLHNPESLTNLELDILLEEARKTKLKQLKEINKMTRTKEDFMSEINLEIETKLFKQLKEVNKDFEDLLSPVEVQAAVLYLPLIEFKRKVASVYHEERGTFIPVDSFMNTESTVILYFSAEEIAEKIKDESIRTIILKLKRSKHNANIVLMINGYEQFMQNLKAQNNRAFVSEVMKKMGESQKAKKKKVFSDITAEVIASKLAELEVVFGVHLFYIKGLRELVEWLKSFCYTMGAKYYDPSERNFDLSNIGRIKSGQTPKECYEESLKQFKYMVSSSARALTKRYGSMIELADCIGGSERLSNDKGEPILRADVEANLKKMFMCDDPNEILQD